MTPVRRWLVLGAALMVVGCGKSLPRQAYDIHKKASFKIGEQWIITPPHEINATSIRIDRTTYLPAAEAPAPAEEPAPAVDESFIEQPATAPAGDQPAVAETPAEPPAEPPAPQAILQSLTVDLTNGRATFTDSDGRSFPQQVEQSVVQQIHAFMADRSWQVMTIKPQKDAPQVTTYVLTVFEQAEPLKSTATWSMPPRRELPEVFKVLIDTFDRAHRYAYPLSQEINLLK